MSSAVPARKIPLKTPGELALAELGFSREKIATNTERWHAHWNIPDTVTFFRQGYLGTWKIKFVSNGATASAPGNLVRAALLRLDELER